MTPPEGEIGTPVDQFDDKIVIIPFQVDEFSFSVVIVLQDHNIERIKQYDPAEISILKIVRAARPASGPIHGFVRDVILMYATQEDLEYVLKMTAQTADAKKGLQHLARGFRYRPDRGDGRGVTRINGV